MRSSAASVSGVGLTVRPGRYEQVLRRVGGMENLEVHGGDPAAGRMVVVQEHATVAEHEQGLRQLQGLPGVLAAGLVCHYQLDGPVEHDHGDIPGEE